MRPKFSDRCAFGLNSVQSAETARKPLAEFVTWIGEHASIEISTKAIPSYAVLAQRVREDAIDVAWLPPVLYIALEQDRIVTPLVSNHRAGQAAFHGVFLVRASAPLHTLDGLRGLRVAWVDPFSASGYVMPRIQLAALGIDPRKAFAEETFAGSHDAAVRALLDGTADVAATFARVDGGGNVTSGSWSQIPEARTEVRVLWTFGAIPSDVIAARLGYSDALCERIADAFVASTNAAAITPIARRIFGVEEFRRGHMQSYVSLRNAIAKARANGLIDDLRLGSL
jgi:phosphate/phosphite/phosphonate ABC transporter binding protein